MKSTVHDYLELWNWDGTLERIHHTLYVAVREQAGREASPTTAIIDSQSAKRANGARTLAEGCRPAILSGTSADVCACSVKCRWPTPADRTGWARRSRLCR